MTSPRQTAKAIDSQAAEWAARIDARVPTPDEEAALETWLAGDVRRQGAFARARAALWVLDDVATPADQDAPFHAPIPVERPVTRRWLMAASVAGLAGAVGLFQGRPSAAKPRRYVSEIGEVRVIPLADGSRITLSTNSAVSVDYRHDERQLRLLRGEAFFEVASNPARPFVVLAPQAQARAVGTAYGVRLLDNDEMKVLVTEGRVSVEPPRTKRPKLLTRLWPAAKVQTVYLDPGQEATVRAAPETSAEDQRSLLVSVATLSADEAQRTLAWRDGRLSFEGQTLAAAAAEFARFSPQRIVIEDDGLAHEHVSGLFAAADPQGFSQAAAIALGARTRQEGDTIFLYR